MLECRLLTCTRPITNPARYRRHRYCMQPTLYAKTVLLMSEEGADEGNVETVR